MLTLKPNCELCDKNLPPEAHDARICSYECTFCENCVSSVLENVCPNCGGEFTRRPIRPKKARREGVSLGHHPASSARVHSKFSRAEITEFAQAIKSIKPEKR